MPCLAWRESSSWLRFNNLFNCMCFIPVLAVLCLLLKSPGVSTHILKGRHFSSCVTFLCAFMNKWIWGGGILIKCFQFLWFFFFFFNFNRKRVKTATWTETQGEFGVGFPKHAWTVPLHLQASLLSIEGSYKKANKAISHTPTGRTNSNSE